MNCQKTRLGLQLRIWLTSILGVIIGVSTGCSSKPDPNGVPRGILVGAFNGIVVQPISDEDATKFPIREILRNERVLCIGPGGMPIVKCDGPDDTLRFLAGDSLFQLNQLKSELLPFQLSGMPEYHVCNHLDYDSVSQKYLYLGALDTLRGMFILDADFRIEREIGSLFAAKEDISLYGRAFFTRNGVVFDGDLKTHEIRVLDTTALSLSSLGYGGVEAISMDRKSVVVREAFGDSAKIIGLEDGSQQLVLTPKRNGSSFAFSPSGKYLAYTRHHGLTDYSKIYIFERMTGKVVWTKICNIGGFVWLGN